MAQVKNIEQQGSTYHFDLEQQSGQVVHVVYKTAQPTPTKQLRGSQREESN